MIRAFAPFAVVLLNLKQNTKRKNAIVANGKCKSCGNKNKPKIKELKRAISDGLTFPEAVVYADFEGLTYSQVYKMFINSLSTSERELIHKIKW